MDYKIIFKHDKFGKMLTRVKKNEESEEKIRVKAFEVIPKIVAYDDGSERFVIGSTKAIIIDTTKPKSENVISAGITYCDLGRQFCKETGRGKALQLAFNNLPKNLNNRFFRRALGRTYSERSKGNVAASVVPLKVSKRVAVPKGQEVC